MCRVHTLFAFVCIIQGPPGFLSSTLLPSFHFVVFELDVNVSDRVDGVVLMGMPGML